MPAGIFAAASLMLRRAFAITPFHFSCDATGRQFIFAFFFAFSVRFTLDEFSTADVFTPAAFAADYASRRPPR
jgi:hypothetical protein